MKWRVLLAMAILTPLACVGVNRVNPLQIGGDQPRIAITHPYVAILNQSFNVDFSLVPAPDSNEPVTVKLDPNPYVRYSQSRFQLRGQEHKILTATIVSKPTSGLVWLYARGMPGYEAGDWAVVDVGFDGHLKSTWSETLGYDEPTTLSLTIVDNEGKPILFEGGLEVKLDSADGVLDKKTITVPSASRSTSQFQLRPESRLGGNVHLTAVLAAPNYDHILAQEQFSFPAKPAWWIPILLAIGGGLLHAAYKIARLSLPAGLRQAMLILLGVVATSCISAFIGYIFAGFDLLGLKLDPNVLRTYPIVGFLFSYLGMEGILSGKFSTSDQSKG